MPATSVIVLWIAVVIQSSNVSMLLILQRHQRRQWQQRRRGSRGSRDSRVRRQTLRHESKGH